MKTSIFGLMLALVLSGCGGGGSSATPAAPAQVAQATPTPGAIAAGNHIAAAPAQVFTSSGVRKPQSVTLGNGIPTVVVRYSATMGSSFSQLYAWAANPQSQAVPETSMTVTPSGPMTVTAPTLDNANAFSLTLFDWIISPNVLSGTGKINLVVAFGDGTTGIIPYYSYDGWVLSCGGVNSPGSPGQWAYQGGVPVGQVLPADMTIDCAHQTVSFPSGGAMLAAPPVADNYGNLATAFTTLTQAATFVNNAGTLSIASTPVGAIYIAKLNDGGFAKIMPLAIPLPFNLTTIFGISEHDSPNGSGHFAF